MFLEIYYQKEKKEFFYHLLIDTFGSEVSEKELLEMFLQPVLNKYKPCAVIYGVYSDISEYHLKSKLISDELPF